MTNLLRPFPNVNVGSEHNPAMRLFGSRFFHDQRPLELLAELLSVVSTPKRIGDMDSVFTSALPPHEALLGWPDGRELMYKPPVKLNLKLFGLLGISRVDTRHELHRDHYETLATRLRERVRRSSGADKATMVVWIEELLRGLRGIGENRSWCAQMFFPVSKSLLTRETVWNEAFSRRESPVRWSDTLERLNEFYGASGHRFLARGGELLFLQLCNALRTPAADIAQFVGSLRSVEPDCLSAEEADPNKLHEALERGFGSVCEGLPALDGLVDFVNKLDEPTNEAVADQMSGWMKSAWCPAASWPEGYLFAVELSRVLRTELDPTERVELLTTGCVLQAMRSLCAQSVRAIPDEADPTSLLGYSWILTPPTDATRPLRIVANRNLETLQRLIQRALRLPVLVEIAANDPRIPGERLYREADARYGHKLLVKLGKNHGMIVPRTGPGARLVLPDHVLRYLVLALVGPGERCAYDEFRTRLFLHYGIAVEGDELVEAAAWSGHPKTRAIQPANGGWLAPSLRASGFLVELADGCSIVRNSYQSKTLNEQEAQA